jgi:Uncharacterized low-complexity proteins
MSGFSKVDNQILKILLRVTSLVGKYFVNTNFDALYLEGFDFNACDIEESSFRGSNVRGGDFTNAVLFEVDFSGADLQGISFDGAGFTRVRFDDADCSGYSNFINLQPITDYCSFLRANMDFCMFSGPFLNADFTGAIITNANFSNADLTGAVLPINANTKIKFKAIPGILWDAITTIWTDGLPIG